MPPQSQPIGSPGWRPCAHPRMLPSFPTYVTTEDHKVCCCYVLSHISVAPSASFPVLFWLSLCVCVCVCVTQGLHQIQKTAEEETKRNRQRERKKDRIQTGKESDRNSFMNPRECDFLRPHGVPSCAFMVFPPLICHVVGHRALSDHVLQTSCWVTTDWDVQYHWHRQLSLSCLLLHHFIAFQSGVCLCVAFCLWGGELGLVSCLGTAMKHWAPACLAAQLMYLSYLLYLSARLCASILIISPRRFVDC